MPYGWDTWDFKEEVDLKNYPVWACVVNFCVPAWRPLFTWTWYLNGAGAACVYAPEFYSYPTSHGMAWRVYKGYGYVTSQTIKDENEIKRREIVFRERIAPVIDDPFGHWDKLKAEFKAFYDRVIPLNLGQMGLIEASTHFRHMIEFNRRNWELHHLGLHGIYIPGFILFSQLCPELTGVAPTDVKYSKLVAGFDSALFQLNKGLAELATRALELKLDDKFKLPDEEVLPAMEQSDAGKQWLKNLNDFLQVHGWRMVRVNEFCTPTWVEKPSLVVPEVRRLIAIGGVHAPDRERARLVKERQEIERELLDKVPAEQKEWFGKLMVCAQAAQFFSEDHVYWSELRCFSLIRRAAMELGHRFVGLGTLDDAEDIHYLFPDEIVFASDHRERAELRSIINRRKDEHNEYLAHPPISEEVPMFLGDPATIMEAMDDAAAMASIGAPVAKPEEVGATCVGCTSAPGVVEGIARVIMSEAEMDQIQPGEILIAPFTTATWTPVFSIVKAVVTDAGGVIAHAAIVAREYGIPAVVGCQDATRKIKTGDKVRVDGNLLRIYVL